MKYEKVHVFVEKKSQNLKKKVDFFGCFSKNLLALSPMSPILNKSN